MWSSAVLAVLLALGVGLPVLDHRVSGLQRLPVGEPYLVGAGIAVTPPPGAWLDASRTRRDRDGGVAVFVLDPGRRQVRYGVSVDPYDGSLKQAAERLTARLTRTARVRVAAGQDDITTLAGMRGREGRYLGTRATHDATARAAGPQAGRYAVFVIGGRSVEVTVIGADADVARFAPAVRKSIVTIAERR